MPEIHYFHILNCSFLLLFFVSYDGKINISGVFDQQTNRDISRCQRGREEEAEHFITATSPLLLWQSDLPSAHGTIKQHSPPHLLSPLHHLRSEFMLPVTCDLWSVIWFGPGVDIKKWHSNPILSGLTQAQMAIESHFLIPWWPLTEFASLLPGTRRVFQNLNP